MMARHTASRQLTGPSSSNLAVRWSTSRLEHTQTYIMPKRQGGGVKKKERKETRKLHSLPKLHDGRGCVGQQAAHIGHHVPLVKLDTRLCGGDAHKTSSPVAPEARHNYFFKMKWRPSPFAHRCSTCCCSATTAAPPGSCRTGRRGPRPG